MSTQLVQTQQVWQFTVMTDEPKDVRLPFMVTASEAKAIDEWRYNNKIPSRAEAMRSLIQRGLAFDSIAKDAKAIARTLSNMDIDDKDEELSSLLHTSLQQMKVIHAVLWTEFQDIEFEATTLRKVLQELLEKNE